MQSSSCCHTSLLALQALQAAVPASTGAAVRPQDCTNTAVQTCSLRQHVKPKLSKLGLYAGSTSNMARLVQSASHPNLAHSGPGSPQHKDSPRVGLSASQMQLLQQQQVWPGAAVAVLSLLP